VITDVKMALYIKGVCSDCGQEIAKMIPVDVSLLGQMGDTFRQNGERALEIGHVCQNKSLTQSEAG